jgi:DNA ligase-1
MSEYLSQSAVEYDKLPVRVRNVLATRNLSDHYLLQFKYDGVCGIVVTGKKVMTRVGTPIISMDHILEQLTEMYGPDIVVFGEFWKPNVNQSTINGSVARHKPDDTMQFIMFDMITLKQYIDGKSERGYMDRYNGMWMIEGEWQPSISVASTFNPGTYGDYKLFRKDLLERNKLGFDGVILRDPTAPWIPGKDKSGYVIKDKNVDTYDLEVVAVEEGKGKYAGTTGAIVVRYKDSKLVSISGMSDDHRQLWWAQPKCIIGKIVEVHSMGLSSNGSLREPRFKGIRTDKDKPDF